MQIAESTIAVGARPYVENRWPVPSAKISVITPMSASEPTTRPKPARRSRSA